MSENQNTTEIIVEIIQQTDVIQSVYIQSNRYNLKYIKKDIFHFILMIYPFMILNFIYGFSNNSCIKIYPNEFSSINLQIYLLVEGFYIFIFSTIIFYVYLYGNIDLFANNIVIQAFEISKTIFDILGLLSFVEIQNECKSKIKIYMKVLFALKFLGYFNILINIMLTKSRHRFRLS